MHAGDPQRFAEALLKGALRLPLARIVVACDPQRFAEALLKCQGQGRAARRGQG